MSTIIVPNSGLGRSLGLQTKAGRDIPNCQGREIGAYELRQARRQRSEHAGARFRCGPDPTYNCHGLTFAARRTCLVDNRALLDILADDGYTEIVSRPVLPGDIITYTSEKGDIEHSGVVVWLDTNNLLFPNAPWVLSKWGKGEEAVHIYYDCPYTWYAIKYYRMEPQ